MIPEMTSILQQYPFKKVYSDSIILVLRANSPGIWPVCVDSATVERGGSRSGKKGTCQAITSVLKTNLQYWYGTVHNLYVIYQRHIKCSVHINYSLLSTVDII